MRSPARILAAATILLTLTAAAVPECLAQAAGDQIADQESLAEKYLGDLSAKSKRLRNTAGAVAIGGGILITAGGAAMLGEEDDYFGFNKLFGTFFLITGGVTVVAGAISLSVPSPAERTYRKTRSIEDPGERERACADGLAGLARKGRRARILGGAVTGAVAVALAAASAGGEDAGGALAGAAALGASAAYTLLVKSPAEKAHRAYLEQRGVKQAPQLVLGFGPHRSVVAGLALGF